MRNPIVVNTKPLRIAWIGTPSDGGGVGGFCRQLLKGLIEAGDLLTAFVVQPKDEFLRVVEVDEAKVSIVSQRSEWEWGKWYSSHPTVSFVSSFWKRRNSYRKLIDRLVNENHKKPFDLIVQFSQIELFNLQKHLGSLPPVLLFPCVHAAGELRWHKRECSYALKSESRIRHYLIRSNLIYRSRVQRRCCQAVHGVIGMSKRFNELVAQDYGVDSEKQSVVYQPIDHSSPFSNIVAPPNPRQDRKIKLLFVGRVSVRKGIEMIIELSHRLDDLGDKIEIEVIGGGSLWSDYTKHLVNLNARVAWFSGSLDHAIVKSKMSEADGLLVPSHYEPGGIVVAEALNHGCTVIVSDEVGSAEPLSRPACRKFPAGSQDAFELTVRKFVTDVLAHPEQMRAAAMDSANRCFSPDETIAKLRGIFRLAASRRPISEVYTENSPSNVQGVQ